MNAIVDCRRSYSSDKKWIYRNLEQYILIDPMTEAAFALSVINTCANVILMITQIISVGIICKCIDYNKPNYTNYD